MPRSSNQKATTAKKKATSLRAGDRKCTRCKTVFYKEKGVLKALCSECKSRCKRCNVKLTEDNYPLHLSKRMQSYCRACMSETSFLGNHKDNGKRRRDSHLNRKYGITLIEYDAILEKQQGACFICEELPKEGKHLHVDHRHVLKDKQQNPRDTRKRVRGLLCWHCNAALGKFKDSITLLRAAAAYLEELPAQQVLNKGDKDGD